ANLKTVWSRFRKAFWALLTPLIIIIGIFSGFFTPTEAAVVSTVYAMILGFFVYKELTLKILYENIVESLKLTGVVVLIMAGVEFFGQFIVRERVAIKIADIFLDITENQVLLLLLISLLLLFLVTFIEALAFLVLLVPVLLSVVISELINQILLLLLISLLLLILGTFIEALALLVLLVPVLLPVATSVGIDSIFFGVFVIINLMIGILTPPMGMALFVVSRVGNIPVGTMY